MKQIAVILLALSCAGCVTNGTTAYRPDNKNAVCKALKDPIKYNSQNPKSQRYAGALLALDLKERNSIGRQLNCPQFR
jgi:hypothetical protein